MADESRVLVGKSAHKQLTARESALVGFGYVLALLRDGPHGAWTEDRYRITVPMPTGDVTVSVEGLDDAE